MTLNYAPNELAATTAAVACFFLTLSHGSGRCTFFPHSRQGLRRLLQHLIRVGAEPRLRLCLVPDGDFFAAIRSGRAEVVTGRIARFTPRGVRVLPKTIRGHGAEREEVYAESGAEVDIAADIIVTATGIEMQQNFPMSTVDVDVDGVAYDAPQHFVYRGCMLSDVPNFFFTMGYANISWTLKADLVSRWLCALVNDCGEKSVAQCCPRRPPNDRSSSVQPEGTRFFDLDSGYLQRSAGRMPKQGAQQPWRLDQDVLRDYWRYHVEAFGGKELERVAMSSKL